MQRTPSSPRLEQAEHALANRRALVIGGSVGGMFAALLLRQNGWDVAVYERAASDLGDRGTGIGTRPELFAVLRQAGIDSASGIRVDGRTRLEPNGQASREIDMPAVTSAWSHVWRPLRRAMPEGSYFSGRTLVQVRQHERGVTAEFADGSRETGDLLVGADGIHSTVRGQFLPGLAPKYAGYVAWRGAIWADRLDATLHEMMFHRMVFGLTAGELMLSIPMPSVDEGAAERGCHFVWFRPAGESALAELCTDASGRRHGTSIPPPLIRSELIDALKRDAAGRLAPQLAALVSSADPIILQPIFDLESPCIAFGRVALVGDAAFVARPHVASGVMKVAIDAQCLATALKDETAIEAALQRYNAERQPYGAWLVDRGRHIARSIASAGTDPAGDETLMREYGSAGLVGGKPMASSIVPPPDSTVRPDGRPRSGN